MAYRYSSRLWWIPAVLWPISLLVASAMGLPHWLTALLMVPWVYLCIKAHDSIRPNA